MQQLAHVIVNCETILVLMRRTKYGHALKLRKQGIEGKFAEDESAMLTQSPAHLEALKAGQVVQL